MNLSSFLYVSHAHLLDASANSTNLCPGVVFLFDWIQYGISLARHLGHKNNPYIYPRFGGQQYWAQPRASYQPSSQSQGKATTSPQGERNNANIDTSVEDPPIDNFSSKVPPSTSAYQKYLFTLGIENLKIQLVDVMREGIGKIYYM